MNWRDQKRKMHADVHAQFKVPAVFMTHSGASPIRVNVRQHMKSVNGQGIQQDDWNSAAVSNMITADAIIFDLAELPIGLLPKCMVIFSATEAWITGPSSTPSKGYQSADVTQMPQADLNALLGVVDQTAPAWEGIL